MPKKKNYETVLVPASCSIKKHLISMSSDDAKIARSGPRDPADADIDMVLLLGKNARLVGSARNIYLRPQLNRGIDEWVFATADALRSLLRGGSSTMGAASRRSSMLRFFSYLTSESIGNPSNLGPNTPADLKPQHVDQFILWLKNSGVAKAEAISSTRVAYNNVKAVLLEMFNIGLINGEPYQFFRRGVFKRDAPGKTTSLSESEQQSIANAAKLDLSAVYHGRLQISARDLQALRFLVVAHRLGHNTTPLLELSRDAVKPGLLPGTVLLQTTKYRSRLIDTQMGMDAVHPILNPQAGSEAKPIVTAPPQIKHEYLPFNLAEGAVIGQAIASTSHLVERAPEIFRNRVWLYEYAKAKDVVAVTALSQISLFACLKAFVSRHNLVGDDGNTLIINTSRFRKSRFDRIFRIADGDLAVTANFMGNTPQVASFNYPSMNLARKAEASEFINEDYIWLMREFNQREIGQSASSNVNLFDEKRIIRVLPEILPRNSTPVGSCSDTIGGEHAPKTGSHCDRFIMCLFCSSFAVVGTVDELWKLFSFQAGARLELEFLEDRLGAEPSNDIQTNLLTDLRDRYRLAIPFIESFTQLQFAKSRVDKAKNKTNTGLHPFWKSQISHSRRARSSG